MKKLLKCFILCGVLGWCIEIIFTALGSLRQRDFHLKGVTSLWMFPIYGLSILIIPMSKLLKNKSAFIRGTVYMCMIFLVEYTSGHLLKSHKICPWDYSKCKLNYEGIIRLDYAPCWFATGLLYEKILNLYRNRMSASNN